VFLNDARCFWFFAPFTFSPNPHIYIQKEREKKKKKSKRAMNPKDSSEETTKVSVSILGDAFADIFCNLEKGLPPRGGDVRVATPSKSK
jgi:hypothetical protein